MEKGQEVDGQNRPVRTKRLVMVRGMIRAYNKSIKASPEKLSLSDFIRLLSLEKELAGEGEAVREVIATWVQPLETEFDT